LEIWWNTSARVSHSRRLWRTNVFNPFHVNVIKAGEYGGNLTGALQRISQAIEREMELRSRIRNAVAYPAFLICFGLLSLAIMMLFVLPKFLTIYQEMNAKLPLVTSIMLKTSGFLRIHGIWMIPLLGVAIGGSLRYLFRFRENLSADRLRMGFPLIGTIIRNVETATFLRTLGLLIQSGIPVVRRFRYIPGLPAAPFFLRQPRRLKRGFRREAAFPVKCGGRGSLPKPR
jgi:type II secretory pathway component PulF